MKKYVVFTPREKALAFARESIEGNCQVLMLGNPFTKAIKVALSIDDSDEEIMIEDQIKMFESKGFVRLKNPEIKGDWYIDEKTSAGSLADSIVSQFEEDIFSIDVETKEVQNVTSTKTSTSIGYRPVQVFSIPFNNYQNHSIQMYVMCESRVFDDTVVPNLDYIIPQLHGRVIEVNNKSIMSGVNFKSNNYPLDKQIEFRIVLGDEPTQMFDFINMRRIEY